jgi:ABC-type Mn2+/Zn2+ transport system permease subunit
MIAVPTPQGSWWPSWELFGDAMVLSALLGALLPLAGTALVLRQQVFVAASIGQASALGAAAAMFVGHTVRAVGAAPAVRATALAAAIATAVMSMRALSVRATTLEARNAWIFLIGGSMAMVLLASDPHGLQEVQRMQLSSVLFATTADVWAAAVALAAATFAVCRWPRSLALWATDPWTARAQGVHTTAVDVLVGTALGAVIGYAVSATGLLFTFGCTVLPVLCARELAKSLRGVVVAASAAGVAAQAVGLAVANRFDLPPGQATVVVLTLAAVVARAAARRTPRT